VTAAFALGPATIATGASAAVVVTDVGRPASWILSPELPPPRA
jgi:hypothetical protein